VKNANSSRAKLLHIEDNEDDRFILRECLASSRVEFEISSAGSLAAGLVHLANNPVDLVLTDLSLPDSLGIDTFESLQSAAPDCPIVLLTGQNDEEFALQLLAKGAQDYLPKQDMNRRSVLRAIRYAMERKRSERALRALLDDQQQKQEAIKRAEKHFRLVIEMAPNAMIMVEANGCIGLVNSQAEKMFGYERHELLNLPVEVLMPDRFRGGHERWRGAFFDEPSIREMAAGRELVGLRKDGSEVPIEIALNPISSPEGQFVLASIADITDRKLAEATLKRSLTEKLAMLQEVHHRAKNNLQIISSLLSLQASSLEDQAAVAKLQDSERRLMAMAIVHEQLYGRDDMSSIDLAEYIRQLTANLCASFARPNSSFTHRLELTPVILTAGQAVPCGLLLNELITNALKYAYPKGEGEVAVLLCLNGDSVSLTVADRGVGLPVDLDWKTTPSLGMTIIRILTEQLEGKIECDTANGVRFTVRFGKEDVHNPLEITAA